MQTNKDLKEQNNTAEEDSAKSVNAIISSPARKKIVVAGPGTGKTFLFKSILAGKKKSLTLTFINSLVEDLSLELCGISEVRTLHSFALAILKSRKTKDDIKIFPLLSDVIREDAKVLLDKDIDFEKIFNNMEDDSKYLKFYKDRKDYYGDYYGFSDIVYALVKYFNEKPDKIPEYDQILVDEFQDFNNLEISLIDILAEKSPLLLAGDDDQALYGDLKSASVHYIREKHEDVNYKSYSLPYSRRSSKVIVEAVNDIVTSASNKGLLKERIKKEYKYFSDPEKDRESERNPKIIYSQQFERAIPMFIVKQLKSIAEEMRDDFNVLIITPTELKSRSKSIANNLKIKGLLNMKSVRKRSENTIFLEGLRLLLKDKNSNLGWRIVSKVILGEQEFEDILKGSYDSNEQQYSELIDSETRRKVKKTLTLVRKIRNGKTISEEEYIMLLKDEQYGIQDNIREFMKKGLSDELKFLGDPSIRNIKINANTLLSSKGLEADYVFITHFDDKYFIKDKDKEKISDREICNFIVALTRAKRRVYLISTDLNKQPCFLNWINPKRIEKI